MMRLGHYRPVHVKSREAQLLRTTLIARRKFVTHMLAIEQTIRGLLKVYGLKLGQVHRCTFAAKVADLLENKAELRVAIEPLSKPATSCVGSTWCSIGICRRSRAKMRFAGD
jgi:transposase